MPLSIKFIVKVCSLLYYFRLFSNFIYACGPSDQTAAAIASILPSGYHSWLQTASKPAVFTSPLFLTPSSPRINSGISPPAPSQLALSFS